MRKSKNILDEILDHPIWQIAVVFWLTYLLLRLSFILATIILLIWLIRITVTLNNKFKWYETKYYYATIISWLITVLIMVLWGWYILYNAGKVDTTFTEWAKQTTSIVSLKSKKWKTYVEPNVQGIILEWINNNTSISWSSN